MSNSTDLTQRNHYGLGRRIVAKLLITTMLVLDIPIVPLVNAETINPDAWVTVPVKADPMMQGLNIPASASIQGMWSGVQSWPITGIHAAILPDGKLLTYGTGLGGGGQDARTFDVWDSALGFVAGSHQTTYRAQQQNSFCSTATYLNDGRLMVTGGNNAYDSSLFNSSTNTLTQSPSVLASSRWYSTMIKLPDGRPLVLGGMLPYAEGMEDNPALAIAQGEVSMTPEILESTGWRSLLGANSRDAFGPDYLRTSYPRAWVAPNGQVFGISSDKMWYLDPNGNGAITYVGNFKQPYSAANPVNAGATSTAVMYAPGKILQVGGNGGFNGDGKPASNKATVIDINAGTPVLTEQPAMSNTRRLANSIVLANGQVVVTGGTRLGNNNGADAVFAAEIWNPTTSSWTVGANAAIYRGYHSASTLMPNGAILSFGGGSPGPVENNNAEVYYPPYLFRNVSGASQLTPRPVIQAISGLSYNNNAAMQLDMTTTAPISQLVLIGVSIVTHSFNTGQRRIPLTFTQESFRLTTAIPNANLAPPGYYQVVALDANGTPSLGAIIAIGQGVSPPVVPITPYTPPDLGGTISAPVLNSGGTANYSVPAIPGITYSWNFGDGSADTAYNANPAITHIYTQAGVYVVTLSAKDSSNVITRRTFLQAVATSKTANSPSNSTPIALEARAGNSARIWVVNPDNDSVSVIDAVTKALAATVNVGVSPRTVAVAPDGRIWVTNKGAATISVINPTTLAVVQTIALPRASQPHGVAFAPAGGSAFVALEATGQLLKLNPSTGAQQGAANVGSNARHVTISANAATVLVSRFITPPIPGESTATVDTSTAGGEVVVVNSSTMAVSSTVVLRHSDKTDTEIQGSGIPNYLAAAVISPDGTTAWVPSKQDNIKRGTLRNAQNLDFQNTVRAISSRIDMNTLTEDYAKRIDHDNSSVGSAAVYHPSGVYMFVALETSRQVAVVDAIGGRELFKLNVGRAPQGLSISADGNTLYVQEFMDRSVSVIDLTPLTTQGLLNATQANVIFTVNVEKLPAQVVLGKQLFYDAKDTRLARDSYMSCASCHNDAGHDGRVWDLTGFGEGLRNTIALKGRAGTGHGFLHWSANFDEVQDFEKQIRDLAGGLGLMTDANYNAGTRNQPLGNTKAGFSASLDDLAAYVNSLNIFAQSPNRNTDGSLTAAATAGKVVFNTSCASCHTGSKFTISSDASNLKNIGTIKASSGQRLAAALTGIDVPTLRDVWATAPYLHDGSAPTLTAALQAHNGIAVTPTDVTNLVAYLQQIGSEEMVGMSPLGAWKFDEGAGTTVADNSGQNHPLTLTNTTWVAGKAGQAGQFNGTNAVGSTSGSIVNTTQSFSVSAWVKLSSLTGWRTVVSQDGASASGFYLQYAQALGNKFSFSLLSADSTSATEFAALSTATPVTGQWYHVVGVRNQSAGTIKLYVNGVLQATTAYTGSWASNGNFNVGRAKWGGGLVDWLAGSIDEVSAYGYALSDSEVTQLFNTGGSSANVAPTVNLTAPAANASFVQGAAIAITANAADGDGTVAQVEFYDGATLIGTDTTAPYSMSLTNAILGTHTLTAKAYDNLNATTTSAGVTVTVTAAANVAPTVNLTAPAANASFVQGAAIAITANAADGDGTVAQVEFYDGATLIGTDTTAPYSMSLTNAILGTHTLTAKAYDNLNATTTSAGVTVTVTAAANVAPTVNLTAPAANASFVQGAAIAITANAADGDGTVAQVEFYDGATLIGTDTTAPYSMSLTNAILGTHTLTAKAYDNLNATTTSAGVTVTVTAANTLGKWKFDEGTGTTVADNSGQNHPLTLTNTTWVAGKAGQAGQFNGTNAVGSTSGSIVNTTQSFSVSAWVKLSSLTGWRTVVSQDGASASGFYLQYAQALGNKFSFSLLSADSTSATEFAALSTATPVTGQWYHVVGVRNQSAGTIKLYVNGVLQATTAYTGSWASNGNFNVGRAKWGGGLVDWLAGSIDEVSAYGYALSDSEVTQLFNTGGN